MYERHFGLARRPFQLVPDPDLLFGSRGSRRATAYLEYGLHQGEGFVVITGEVGAGKTTLVRSLLRTLDADAIVPVQIASTQVDADDLPRLLAAAFGIDLPDAGKPALLAVLQRHLEQPNARGRRALLIVEDAQNLSPRAVEALRMLSDLQVDSTALVQGLLVGQPEFRDVMQRPGMRPLRQRVVASCHLGPLDPREIRDYVEHRLRRVGWQGDPCFEPDAFGAIRAATGGIPRRINLVCDRLLLAAYLAERHAITAANVREVIAELDDEAGPGTATVTDAPPHAERPLREHVGALERRIATLETSSSAMRILLQRLMTLLRQSRSRRVATEP